MIQERDRAVVVVNQAVNYLTIGFANAFSKRVGKVALITGSIHEQGEPLNKDVDVCYINKWAERPALKKLASYCFGFIRIWFLLLTRYRKYEVFFVSLPPMGYLLNLVLPHRFSVVVWDVYPDVFKITGMSERHWFFRICASLNRKAFKRAFHVFTIGDRMADLLSAYVERSDIIIQPIWSIFQDNVRVGKHENPFIREFNLYNKFIVQYSGNIGLTHKVEVVVQLAERMVHHKHILFQIIGRGPRVVALEEMVKRKRLPNCHFLPFQSDEMFPYSLSAADVGIVILDEQTSKGSVPSKSYNLMSFGIPSLYIAGRDSELFNYATKYGHAFCCTEQDLHLAEKFLLELSCDYDRWKAMSERAELAAKSFRRSNADKFIDLYLGNARPCR